jgi:hypothetical protein
MEDLSKHKKLTKEEILARMDDISNNKHPVMQ